MLKLGQFNLQFALVGAGPLGENIQDQPGAVEHPAFELALEIALLAGAQGMIEHHDLGIMQPHRIADFHQLAGADKRARMGRVPAAHNKGDGVTPRR